MKAVIKTSLQVAVRTACVAVLWFMLIAQTPAQTIVTTEDSRVRPLARVSLTQNVNDIVISPNGRTFATLRAENTFWDEGSRPLTLELWAIPKGTLLWRAKEPMDRLLAFSSDGTLLLASTADRKAVFLDTSSGWTVQRLPIKDTFGTYAQFLPDGESLLIGVSRSEGGGLPQMPDAGEIQHWETKTGLFIRALRGQTNAMAAMQISPDGRTVAVASGKNGLANEINLLDIAAGGLLRTLSVGTNVWVVASLAFSPDGKTLAGGGQLLNGAGKIWFWDVASGTLQRTLTGAEVATLASNLDLAEPKTAADVIQPSISFSPTRETLAIVGWHQRVALWDIVTRKVDMSFRPSDPSAASPCIVRFVKAGLLLVRVNARKQVVVEEWKYR